MKIFQVKRKKIFFFYLVTCDSEKRENWLPRQTSLEGKKFAKQKYTLGITFLHILPGVSLEETKKAGFVYITVKSADKAYHLKSERPQEYFFNYFSKLFFVELLRQNLLGKLADRVGFLCWIINRHFLRTALQEFWWKVFRKKIMKLSSFLIAVPWFKTEWMRIFQIINVLNTSKRNKTTLQLTWHLLYNAIVVDHFWLPSLVDTPKMKSCHLRVKLYIK